MGEDFSLPRTLTDEHRFWHLIMGAGMPPLLKRLRETRNEFHSVLDLGCGTGMTLVVLYYSMGATVLHGVERGTKAQLIKEANKEQEQVGSMFRPQSLTDIWMDINPDPVVDLKEKWTSAEACEMSMAGMQFDTPIANCILEREHYDAIIASYLMHYLDHKEIDRVFDIIRNHTSPNGLIYFSMKDGFTTDAELPGAEVLARCKEFQVELQHLGVEYYPGPKTEAEGYCHVFTNL